MRLTRIAERLRGDRRGAYSMVTALMLPVLTGFTALGTETGLWFYTHQTMQGAADAGAFSAATAYGQGNTTGFASDGTAVAAQYGFVNGSNGVNVTVNRPPASGSHTSTAGAVEVIISQPQTRLFSAVLTSSPLTIAARAVAVQGAPGTGCVLSLDPTASVDISAKGTPNVVLNGCSMYDNSNSTTALTDSGTASITALSVNVVGGISKTTQAQITATNGIHTGVSPVADPYKDVTVPPYTPGCASSSGSILNPGVYCGLSIKGTVILNPGLYVIDGGTFTVDANATLSGSGVTLVFTSHTGSSYPTVTINGGATVNLSAASNGTTGPTGFQAMQGIVMYMDRNAPIGTSAKLNGGSSQILNGAVYMPTGGVVFTGGASTASTCLQLIADTISFGGNAGFANNCQDSGTRQIGAAAATLVE